MSLLIHLKSFNISNNLLNNIFDFKYLSNLIKLNNLNIKNNIICLQNNSNNNINYRLFLIYHINELRVINNQEITDFERYFYLSFKFFSVIFIVFNDF